MSLSSPLLCEVALCLAKDSAGEQFIEFLVARDRDGATAERIEVVTPAMTKECELHARLPSQRTQSLTQIPLFREGSQEA